MPQRTVIYFFLFHILFKLTHIQFVSQKFHIQFLTKKTKTKMLSFRAICHTIHGTVRCVCFFIYTSRYHHRNLSWISLFRSFRRNSKINSLKCLHLKPFVYTVNEIILDEIDTVHSPTMFNSFFLFFYSYFQATVSSHACVKWINFMQKITDHSEITHIICKKKINIFSTNLLNKHQREWELYEKQKWFTWCKIGAEISQKKKLESRQRAPNEFLNFQIDVQQNIMINWDWTSNWQLSIRTPICYKLNRHDCFSFGRRSFVSLSFPFSLLLSFSFSLSIPCSTSLSLVSTYLFHTAADNLPKYVHSKCIPFFNTVYMSILYTICVCLKKSHWNNIVSKLALLFFFSFDFAIAKWSFREEERKKSEEQSTKNKI